MTFYRHSLGFSRFVASGLIPVLLTSPLVAQEVSPAATSSNQIQIHLLDSDGSRVTAGARSGKGLTVVVTDDHGTPISEAAVAFRFPESGPTATFGDGTRSSVAYTDKTGAARIAGFQWGDSVGSVALRVTASKGDSHAGLLIEQSVMSASAPPPVTVRPAPVPSTDADVVLSAPKPIPVDTTPAAPAYAPLERVTPFLSAVRSGSTPAVSITSSSPKDYEYHPGFSKKKWILLGIAAGAGVGIALALSSKGAATAANSGVSVGSPSITIGHP